MNIKMFDKRNSLEMTMPSDPAFYNIRIRNGTAFAPAGDIGKETFAYSLVEKNQKICKSCL